MSADSRINTTIVNSGYPNALVTDMGEWIVMLRPKQITLGSLILAAADNATSFGDLHHGVFSTLGPAVTRIEHVLKTVLSVDKFNYIMLMMVDPHVHFHVIPRYAQPVTFMEQVFEDRFWPKPPDINSVMDMPPTTFETLRKTLHKAFES